MKCPKQAIILTTSIAATTYLIYKNIKKTRYKQQAISLYNQKKYRASATMFLQFQDIDSYFFLSKCFFKLNEFNLSLNYCNLYLSNNINEEISNIKFECLKKEKKYKEAYNLLLGKNDNDRMSKIIKCAVDEEIKNYDLVNIDLSDFLISEYFEQFPLLFKDFNINNLSGNKIQKINDIKHDLIIKNTKNSYNETNVSFDDTEYKKNKKYSYDNICYIDEVNTTYNLKDKIYAASNTINHYSQRVNDNNNIILKNKNIDNKKNFVDDKNYDTTNNKCKSFTDIKLTIKKETNITKFVFDKIKMLITNKKFKKLLDFIEYKKDNLSLFIKISFLYLKRNKDIVRLIKDETLTFNSNYEQKINTYIKVIRDFSIKLDLKYEYEDISTLFFKFKLKNKNQQEYLKRIMQKGIYSFVYYSLLQDNPYFIEDAFKAFPRNCQILTYIFEIYIASKNYYKADEILNILTKYHKNDPRLYICLFLKELVVNTNNNKKQMEILINGYKKDKKYWRICFFIGKLYSYENDLRCKKWLEKSLIHCNDENEIRKILEKLFLIQCKLITNK
ncbi:hypothetical protein COBT_002358 [Conglomerata obtusa]